MRGVRYRSSLRRALNSTESEAFHLILCVGVVLVGEWEKVKSTLTGRWSLEVARGQTTKSCTRGRIGVDTKQRSITDRPRGEVNVNEPCWSPRVLPLRITILSVPVDVVE